MIVAFASTNDLCWPNPRLGLCPQRFIYMDNDTEHFIFCSFVFFFLINEIFNNLGGKVTIITKQLMFRNDGMQFKVGGTFSLCNRAQSYQLSSTGASVPIECVLHPVADGKSQRHPQDKEGNVCSLN